MREREIQKERCEEESLERMIEIQGGKEREREREREREEEEEEEEKETNIQIQKCDKVWKRLRESERPKTVI